MSPNRPTSIRRLSTTTIRIALLLGLVAVGVVALSSTSLASSLGQKLFARVATIVNGTQAAPTSHALDAEVEEAAAAPTENTAMTVERRGHTATRLADGRVLIAGGENSSGTLNQTELYDPASGTFTAGANLGAARADHTATLLADGRVLMAGGRSGAGSVATTEIFDPATGSFTSGPSMSVARAGHSATLFANGRVLIVGGDAAGSAEIFDLAAGTSTATGSLAGARSMHSAALLLDGRVLVVGGRDGNGNELLSGEIFDTPAGAFSTIDSDLKVGRVRAHLRVLFDGKVQIIGGNSDGSMEIYDPLFEGFGAYAHVAPEGDTCAGLPGYILTSQTRAALFHNGQSDVLFDRSGHTITELGGQALVLGGVNSSGAVLNSSSVVGSSSASITTDKMDYAPGETATITGRGFQPGEVVRLKIHEDPHTPQERGFDATADADGNFSGEYVVQDYDVDMKFLVGARGLTSGATAQTTMTDARQLLLTFAGTGTGTVTVTPNTGTVNAPVSCGGTGANAASQTVSATCLPNISTSDNGATVTFNAVANPGSTFGGWSLPSNLSSSTCTGTTNPCSAVLGNNPTLTVTFNAGNINTNTAVANASATYGDPTVTLNATVTPTSGPAVNNGSVAFTIKQGATTIGATTTDNTVVAGAASVNYALPAGTNAGPYTIQAVYTPGAGFNGSNGSGTLTINKRAIEVTADTGQFKTYGDADPTFTYTITNGSLVAPDAFTGALSRVAGENAGLYAITIGTLAINDGNGGNNYTLTFVSKNFEIKKRAATWTTNPASKTYGDADPSPLTTGSGSNFVAADNVTATYSRAAGENASPPTYHITATLSATPLSALDNYIITNDGAEFTINKRLATWTTNPASKTYGDPDPSPLTTGSGSNFVAADNVTATYSRVAGENASPPTYHITATLSATPLSALDNYIITNDGAEFTINKRLATWTTNPASKTYGDPDPSPLTTGSGSNFVAADNVTATYSRVAGENASPPTYHITATLSATPLSALDNYIITNDGAEFTINKRLATWTTDPASKTYGDPDPSPLTTGSGSNFVAADNVTATYSRVAGENASPPTYHITATLSATPLSALDNYIITNTGNEFTINKRLATWTTDPASKTYGDPDPSPLTTGSGSNFVAADNVTATYSRVAGENASPPTYHITATLSATPLSALDNYIITNAGNEFTINKRLATWTTDPASKTYGDPDPSPLTTGSGSNFVAADNVTASYSRVAGENASPPTYHITATLSATPLSALDNYIITNAGNEFTINKRLATWNTDPASKTYGDPDPSPLTTGSGSNFVAADNVTATYSRVAGENASPPTYHITATLSATPASALDNYIITNAGNEFTINKRVATWTTDPASKTYGDADPSPLTTGSGSNFVAADNVTATYSRVAGENASPPTYHITATLSATPLSALDNYIITNTGAEFTINKRLATWTTDPASKTYGDPDPSPLTTGSGSNFVAADNVTATYSRVAGENASPPTYHITATLSATPLSALDNYIITNTGNEFTINKRVATWTTDPASKTYGDADPSPLTTGSGSNFVAADNVTATYSRVAGENASPPTYHITATLSATPASALDNYIITNAGNEFTINKRLATWTTDPASKTYGDPDPSPLTTGSGSNFVAADNVTATYSRVAGENASPPTYHITATLSATPVSALDNYIITNAGNEFTINKRLATWTTDPASKTYGDADPSPLTTGSGSNFVAADNVSATYSRAAGENASPPTYHITATLSATPLSALDNYIITNAGAEFTINKRLATWTTDPASKTYGDPDPSPLTTGSGSNFVAADNVTATYSRVAGENASPPTYHITATLSATPLSALDNYIITNAGNEFTINKRLATWNTDSASKTYGDPDPSPLTTGSGSNFVAADNVTATYSRVAGENASPPTYHITATLSATPLSALDNYIITNAGNEFTINKRLATWTTDPANKTYGDPDPSPLTTGSGSNFVAADNVTATYSRVAGENASPPTYHITATLSATPLSALDNYIITNAGAEFTINKRLATWTTDPASKTYGDPDPSPLTTGSGSNFVAADNVTASYSRVAGENASPPTYHITATLSATPLSALDNYIITNAGNEFSINKRLATWTTDPASKTYGDPDPSPLTTGSGSNFVAADNVSATYSRVAGENASPPTYHITATLSATPLSALDNYIITNAGNEFTINKRLATWTTDPANKTYGDPDPSPLTTGSGSNFVAADNVTASYSRVAGENASPPTYHITATLSATPLSALDNYIITNAGAEFSINKRLATWTTDPASKTYGDPDPSPLTTGSGSNFVAADNVTATYSRVAGENASPPTYHITATLSATPLSALDNYIITNAGAEFSINKRLATWTTDPASKTYGDPDPSPLTTGSGSNFVAADNVTATYSRVAGENASPPTYHITATLSATPLSALDNYIITNAGNEFSINKRLATWTTDPASKTYGDPDPSPLTTGSGSNFVAADNVTATYSRVAGENASPPTYHITATLSATPLSALDNYIITNAGNEFSINKRLATWTTDPASKTYGDPDPSPLTTGSGSNFVAADNVSATYSRVAGENASPPTYHITATLSATPLSALDNYIITNAGNEFSINKRLATWTTDPASKTYGDPDPSPLTTGSGSNFVAADNVTATYSRVAGENASPPTYHITATLSATPLSALNNYIITNDGAEFTINKRLATWTTNPASKTYGDPDPSPLTTGSGSNFVAADNVTATYTRVAGENASPPTYHITATLSATPLSALNNYVITNNGAEFTIHKRPLQVTATAGQFKTYGNSDPTFADTITSGTLAFSDTFTGALSRVAGENVGLYAITIGTLKVSDGNSGNNYNLTLVSNNFEIKKRPISVKADAKTKTFGDPDPVFTYQITSGSLAFSDAFTGALTRDPGELVGQYNIKQGTLAINDGNGGLNYTLTFTGDKLTIVTACSTFNGFLPPIGGAVELGTGGSFANPVRSFKLNSTIPVKFNAMCFGQPLTTGVHTLQAIKYSDATTSSPAIDATPTDAATTGNQFRLTDGDWHFNLNTKGFGNNGQGTWLLRATLFDGSTYSVWVSIKK